MRFHAHLVGKLCLAGVLLGTCLNAPAAFAQEPAPPAESTVPPPPPPPVSPLEQPAEPPTAPPPAPIPGANAWRYIIIHHSASNAGNAAVFDHMHRAKGWDGVAYHFVITNGHGGPDGALEVSPRWWKQKHGAHAGALPAGQDPEERNIYNEFGIGICLVGNFEHHAPTAHQLSTLTKLVIRLRQKFNIPAENIMGHRHVKSTECPGTCFPWEKVFAMAGMTEPHLYRHALTSTFERCPWCQETGNLAVHHAARAADRSAIPTSATISLPIQASTPAPQPVPAAISISIAPGGTSTTSAAPTSNNASPTAVGAPAIPRPLPASP